MEQVAETTAARARAIEAEYGEVFRKAHTIYGEYHHPYLEYLDEPGKIASAERLRRQPARWLAPTWATGTVAQQG